MNNVTAVLRLADSPREYYFQIDRSQVPPILHIPGSHRGPDLCIPQRPEQEKWLDGLTRHMKPYWHC